MTTKNDKAPWHPCDDCIRPIADALDEFVRQWDRMGNTPPHPEKIEWVYRDHDLGFLIVWLKMCLSVDFATDLENMLYVPVREYHELHRRAWELKPRDGEGEGPSWGNAVSPLLDEWHRELGSLPPELCEGQRWDEDSLMVQIGNQFVGIRNQLRDVVLYLQRVEVVLRAKLGDVTVKRDELPPDDSDEWSEQATYKAWQARFDVSERTLHNWRSKGFRMQPVRQGSWIVHREEPAYIEWKQKQPT